MIYLFVSYLKIAAQIKLSLRIRGQYLIYFSYSIKCQHIFLAKHQVLM